MFLSHRSWMIALLGLFCAVAIEAVDLANNLAVAKTSQYNFTVTSRYVVQQFTTTATDADITEVSLNLFVSSNENETGTFEVEIWGYNTSTFVPTTLVCSVASNQPFPTSTNGANMVSFTGLNLRLARSTSYYLLVRCSNITDPSLKTLLWGYTNTASGTGFPSYYTVSTNSGSSWSIPVQIRFQKMKIVANGSTPVVLNDFKAKAFGDHTLVQWETGSEWDNGGFHLWRSEDQTGAYTRITGFLIPAQGSPTSGASYSYNDFSLDPSKKYHYKLEDINYQGKSFFYGPIDVQ